VSSPPTLGLLTEAQTALVSQRNGRSTAKRRETLWYALVRAVADGLLRPVFIAWSRSGSLFRAKLRAGAPSAAAVGDVQKM